MKKLMKSIICVILVVLAVWFVASWIDIVADNTQPNPQHSKYNMFVLMTSGKEEEEEIEIDEEWNNLMNDNTRLASAIIDNINDDVLTIITAEDDREWVVEVVDGDSFSEDDYLCVFFNTMGTDNVEDDEIMKLYVERW